MADGEGKYKSRGRAWDDEALDAPKPISSSPTGEVPPPHRIPQPNNNSLKGCCVDHGRANQAYLQHAGKMFNALASLRRDASHCDVLLQVAGSSRDTSGVWAHRVVLGAASPYFYDKFLSSIKERALQIEIIENVELDVLEVLIDNIYTRAPLVVSIEKAKALLTAATALEVDDVRDAACNFLSRALSIDNAVDMISFAEQNGCTALAAAAAKYIYEHFERIQTHHSQPHGEEPHRRNQGLLQDVQPHHSKHYVVPHYSQVHDQSSAALFVIGGGLGADYSYSSTVLVYPLSSGRWQRVAPLPAPRVVAGAAVLNERVYVVGGTGDPACMRTTIVYDAETDSWLSGPSMITGRWVLGVAALGGRLYAVGGRNSANHFNSVEALDPREGVWQPIASMAKCRGGLDVATLNGMLYAVGGHDGLRALESTERYNPVAGRWQTVESMEDKRFQVGVGVVEDTMYAVGGWYRSTIRSVEKYRVGCGWEPSAPLPTARRSVAVTAYDSLLYAVGGFNDSDLDTASAAVSVFNPSTGAWTELPPLPAGRWGSSAVVVAWPPH